MIHIWYYSQTYVLPNIWKSWRLTDETWVSADLAHFFAFALRLSLLQLQRRCLAWWRHKDSELPVEWPNPQPEWMRHDATACNSCDLPPVFVGLPGASLPSGHASQHLPQRAVAQQLPARWKPENAKGWIWSHRFYKVGVSDENARWKCKKPCCLMIRPCPMPTSAHSTPASPATFALAV